MSRIKLSIVVAVAVSLSSAECFADEPALPALTTAEQRALESIDDVDILATVSFLACDELAGRDTPSPELDIAAAFVASRFRGAGLEGLGENGSFFQIAELPQFVMPKGTAQLTIAGAAQPELPLMFAGREAANMSASLTTETSGEAVRGKIVIVDEIPLPPQAVDNPEMVLVVWSRRLQPIVTAEAAAILIRSEPDSVLSEALKQLNERTLSLPGRFLLPLPVAVVSPNVAVEGEATFTAPQQPQSSIAVKNVVGVLRGSDPALSQQAIIVSAHLDHIGQVRGDRQGDLINNGADDNATGVTGVLELADAFATLETKPKRSLIFMTFWGEEKGLLGSKYFADHPLWPLDRITANVNLEMMGRPEAGAEGNVWATGWGHSSLGPQMALGAARAGVAIFEHPQLSEMLYTRSDNASFVNKGVVAHSFSGGSLHDDYHQPGDEVSKLNIAHMTKTTRGLFAGLLPIANGDLTPVAK